MGTADPEILRALADIRTRLDAQDATIEALRADLQRPPLRLKQFAYRCGISEATARRWAKRGMAVKLSGDWLFDPDKIFPRDGR